MSFGFGIGIGDVALIGKTMYQINEQLSGEAVNDFRECEKTCRRFVAVAKLYEPLLVGFQDKILHDLHRDVRGILKRFVRTIERQRGLLGPSRKKWSFRSAFAKIKWSCRDSKTLDKLRRELETRIQLMNTTIQVIQLNRGSPSQYQAQPPRFILEDASGRVLSVWFSDATTWEDVHQLILRCYQKSQALAVIQSMSYVFNNATTRQDIIPGSPLLKTPRGLIGNDERLVMSVILPLETIPIERCLNCQRRWDLRESAEATCSRCRLWVKIHESYEDEPDYLTRLALDAIRTSDKAALSVTNNNQRATSSVSGLRQFVESFLAEVRSYDSEATCSDGCSEETRRKIQEHFPTSRTTNLDEIRKERFRRILLCSPKWPEVPVPAPLDEARTLLQDTVQKADSIHIGLFPLSPDNYFDPTPLLADIWNPRVRERDWRWQWVTSMRNLYGNRLHSDSVGLIRRYLGVYSEVAQRRSNAFEPASTRTRCLLWTLKEVSQLEEHLIRQCVHMIKTSAPWLPPDYIRPKPPQDHILIKLVTSFIFSWASPPLGYLPVKMVLDLLMKHARIPFVSQAALLTLVANSEVVSFDHTLDESCNKSHYGPLRLDAFFSNAVRLRGNVLAEWEIQYLEALEQLIKLAKAAPSA